MLAEWKLEPSPPERRRRSVIRPDWWEQAVEDLTRDHREHRAAKLHADGRLRAAEVFLVLDRIREGDLARDDGFADVPPAERITREQIHELQRRWEIKRPAADLGPLHPADAPGGEAAQARGEGLDVILRRWSTEVSSSSRGARDLCREPSEPWWRWRQRVIAECHRRLESTWHADRAHGQLERFKRVKTCGTESRGWIACVTCGHHAVELKKTCGNHYLCQGCRDQRKRKYRKRFRLARTAALLAVKAADLHPRFGAEDPIAERFLTLTMPRVPEELGGAQTAVEIIRDAWRKFWNRMRGWWKRHLEDRFGEEEGARRFAMIRYVRVLEATAGRDNLGHVHIHAWVLAPFMRVHVIRWLWGAALLAAGFPADATNPDHWADKADIMAELAAIPRKDGGTGDPVALASMRRRARHRLFWPRVDVRRVYPSGKGKVANAKGQPAGTEDLANELIKYLVKDLGGLGNTLLLPAETWAAIYRGLDGGRSLTCARGFWVSCSSLCPVCNDVHSWTIVGPPEKRSPPPRGPPLYLIHPSDGRSFVAEA